MRLILGGSIARTDPVCLVFKESTTFDKTLYPDYTNYDIIVIGAGGGRGGGCAGTDTNHPTYSVRNYGGAGGGGGFHRVPGLLEFLADSTDIVVGSPGSDGTDEVSDPDDSTNGDDGSHSSFGDFCMASGGKGGKRSVSCSIDENMENDGGNGGLGGITSAGHGAIGGIAGLVDPGEGPAVKGLDGGLYTGPFEYTIGSFTAEGLIGEGGGGGVGGIAYKPGSLDWRGTTPYATEGGRGSYNSDESVFGSRGYPFLDPDHYMAIGPGSAGGARITPLNRSTKSYGNSGEPGVVAILLTKE